MKSELEKRILEELVESDRKITIDIVVNHPLHYVIAVFSDEKEKGRLSQKSKDFNKVVFSIIVLKILTFDTHLLKGEYKELCRKITERSLKKLNFSEEEACQFVDSIHPMN